MRVSKRKPTLEDVAKAAGVSLSTVDRVLNGRGQVAAESERRVLEWAKKMQIDRALDRVPRRLLRIAVLMQRPVNPFYRDLAQGFRAAQQAYARQRVICLISYFDSLDPRHITRKIREIAADVDGLAIAAVDDRDVSAALRAISDKVAVVTVHTDLPDSGRIAYVGVDNRLAGRVAAELMGRFLGSSGKILIVTGRHNFRHHRERETGFRAVIADRFPGCTIVETLHCPDVDRPAADLIPDVLRRHPDLAGIYVISADNADIFESLRTVGRGTAILIGHIMSDDSRHMLFDGTMDVVLDQSPQIEAFKAVEAILSHYRRLDEAGPVPTMPVSIYLRENSVSEPAGAV